MFWFIALISIAFTLSVCIYHLKNAKLEKHNNSANDNAALLQQRLDELNNDLENGVITAEEAENSRKEIQLAILDRQAKLTQHRKPTPRYNRLTAMSLLLFIPVFSLSFYFYLGRPDLLGQPLEKMAAHPFSITPDQIEKMVSHLEQKLNDEPQDVEGWQMLYRSYMVLGRYEKAINTAEKLIELEGETPDVLLRYIDALAMANNRQLTGKPTELIHRILEIQPDNARALRLASMAAEERGDLQQAIDY